MDTPHVKAEIVYDSRVTLDDLIREATDIHKRKLSYDAATSAYPKFVRAYPIVVRYITDLDMFDVAAFEIHATALKNNTAFDDAQLLYVYHLYLNTYKNEQLARDTTEMMRTFMHKLKENIVEELGQTSTGTIDKDA